MKMEGADTENNDSSLRLINAHHQLRCNHRIDLQRLSELVGENGKLHRGRPTMLTCRITAKRVQFFPNGTVQVLGGGVTPFLLSHLRQKIYYLLHLCNFPPRKIHLTQWTLNNAVYSFNLGKTFNFNYVCCDQFFSYEPELFPAALISKWAPIHVTLFPNGKGMITGSTSSVKANQILTDLPIYLATKSL